MAIKLTQTAKPISSSALDKATHLLFVMHKSCEQPPCGDVLKARLKRACAKFDTLAKTPLHADLPGGGYASWVVLDPEQSLFERHTALRKALAGLLDDGPTTLSIVVTGDAAQRQSAAEAAVYVASLNGVALPSRKKKQDKKPLAGIDVYGWDGPLERAVDLAAANSLTRTLTMLPPNELTPGQYREKIRTLADAQGWACEEYDLKKLRKLGAGAFIAVAQGSAEADAAIVHLSYAPKGAKKSIALVGKGICFDTGGHNLKPARYMHGMHEDMNGSAVALGILQAATAAKLPVRIDCWLALAQNHISPQAYKQNDVITALNGKTIEIIHTDAEGRMVLADTLTLASRAKPDLMIDFATLTGSMMAALGNRMSGVIGNRPELLCKAVGIGARCGERVSAFPFEADYDEDLDSQIADIKQCTLDSDADHMLAARFLSKFIENDPAWLHVDLSSCNRKGGLGAVASDVTGFGVSFGFHLLEDFLNPA